MENGNEIKERRRKRAIKVAITETLMVFAVIALVVVSLFITVGYNFNLKNDEIIERTGLVAIQTKPTGATVTVDGEQLFLWTNLSRTMREGGHEIGLTREGYRPWAKNITVAAGLMFRMNYPRLLPIEVKPEAVADFSEVAMYSVAPDENSMLALSKDGNATLFRINEDKVEGSKKSLDTSALPSDLTERNVELVSWSGNSKKIFIRVDGEYFLYNLDRPKESVDVSKKFALDVRKISFSNDSGTRFFALDKDRLVEVDVDSGKITDIVSSGAVDFYNQKDRVIVSFVPKVKGGVEPKNIKVAIYRSGDGALTEVYGEECGETCEDDMLAVIDEYFGDDYMAIFYRGTLRVYKGVFPTSGDESATMSEVAVYEGADFRPTGATVRADGEIMTFFSSDKKNALIYDTETEDVVKITTSSGYDYVDESMIYQIEDGGLRVADFDGKNQYLLVDTGVDAAGEVRISKNDKWMYFLGTDKKLMRMVILL